MNWDHATAKGPGRVFILGGIALCIRLVFALGLVGDMPLMSDAGSYDAVARELLRSFPGTEPYYWPPGLPYLLALWYGTFGTGVWTARLFAITVSTANVLLVERLARLVVGERGARWAGWMMVFYPPSIMMTSQVVSQPVEMTALLTAVICILKGLRQEWWPWLAGAGAALGVGVLTRPSLLSLVAMGGAGGSVALYRALRCSTERSVRTLLYGGGVGLLLLGAIVGPVLSYNASRGGGATIATSSRYNLYLGNNPHTPLYKTNHLASRSPGELPLEVQESLDSFRRKDNPQTAMLGAVAQFVAAHPGETLLRTLNRIREFWGFDYVTSRRIQINYNLGMGPLLGLLALEAGGYAAMMLLVLVGLLEGGWRSFETKRIGLLILGYQLPYWIAFSAGTYHYTVVALLVPFAGAGGTVLWDVWHGRRVLQSKKYLYATIGVFLLMQLEYAYFTYAYSPFG